jgi:5'-nucleotidase
MRILITNDDGIQAPGLRSLVEAVRGFGEVKIVAPDRERSACAHAMTLRDPLRVVEVPWDGLEAYEVNGLPVDCVNVGLSVAYPDGCDLVLSGLNNGPNLGFDVTYSGTVAGAMEGCINGIFSVAFSMAIFVSGAPFHYETGEAWIRENLEMIAGLPHLPGVFYNVNIPAIAWPEVNGHKFVTMGQRVYEDRVVRREDPWGRPYYWQGGSVVLNEHLPGTDVEATKEGFVAITPLRINWTDNALLASLQSRAAPERTSV